VRIGSVGGGFCGHNARSLDARIRLLASQGSLITARRLARGFRLFLFSFAFTVAAESALHAQAQTVSQAMSDAASCHGTQQVKQVAELLFGRDIGHRFGVSQSAWEHFVRREITPRFPDGLTISNAAGQWRDRANDTIVHEPSKRVEIVLPGAADDEARLDAVVAAYKGEFHQQSVTVIVRPACVSF
jgi:hypothetical protein